MTPLGRARGTPRGFGVLSFLNLAVQRISLKLVAKTETTMERESYLQGENHVYEVKTSTSQEFGEQVAHAGTLRTVPAA
jgi:hypothetical protein